MKTAQSLGATIRTNAEVVAVSDDGRSVTLKNGEVIRSDVIVGATGRNSIIQKLLDPGNVEVKPMNLMLFE